MAANKYKRTNFYKQETVNNILENDLVNNYWNLLQIKRPLQFVTLNRQHLQRPDLLSYQIYGDTSYWWIISKFNQIDDWWADVEIGATISVPDKRDLDDFTIKVLALKTRG